MASPLNKRVRHGKGRLARLAKRNWLRDFDTSRKRMKKAGR